MKLKELRKAKNISQEQAANALGISVRAYQNYEYGQREPNIEMIFKLADFYNVTTDYLLGRETGEPEPTELVASRFNMSALEKEILDNYLALPEDMRGDLMEFLQRSVKKVMDESGE